VGDILETLKRYRAEGSRLVGCFPLYGPLELFHSFGLTPVVLWGLGDGRGYYPASDAHVQGYACSVARALTGFVIEHGTALFDALFMYNACDTLRNLPEILSRALDSRGGHIPMFRLHLPAIPLDRAHAARYLEERLRGLVKALEEFTGRSFSGDAFMASATLYERRRSLCRGVMDLRARGGIPSARAARIIELGNHVEVAEHIAGLEEVVGSCSGLPGDARGVRVMAGGIQAPPLELLDAMDSSNLVTVADDFATMARTHLASVSPRPDPHSYYTELYLHHPPCSTLLPSADARLGHLVSRAKASGARGFILFGEKFCEYEYFEAPQLLAAMEREGVRTLFLEIAPEDRENLAQHVTRIEAFAEMLQDGSTGG